MRPRLVFVHGIGGPRDPEGERAAWARALGEGMRASGHAGAAAALVCGKAVECAFAYYGDLFDQEQAQGAGELGAGNPGAGADGATDAVLAELLVAWVEHLTEAADADELRILDHARAEAAPRAQEQGGGQVVRRALNVATTVLALRPWSGAGRWITPKVMVSHLAQVARYLARGESGADGAGLDRRIRTRVAEAVGDGPAVVVAHSLGSVVALEALHEHPAPVPLFVTIGSPLTMRTAVWPRLVPQPPVAPEGVGEWLNFWDRDDVLAVRPRLERDVRGNSAGVVPRSHRVDSDGVWVHSAEKYLAQPAVAGPVAQALARLARPGSDAGPDGGQPW
ncbi:alpha/beta fold hydrolase [Streptomyces sp. NPDC098789]|uniref:alpha/beta fold hydrolase n=1 Tax=Streptomyces sp. NPDC098789 TaxID=3366098 RepID=UPI0038026293